MCVAVETGTCGKVREGREGVSKKREGEARGGTSATGLDVWSVGHIAVGERAGRCGGPIRGFGGFLIVGRRTKAGKSTGWAPGFEPGGDQARGTTGDKAHRRRWCGTPSTTRPP